MFKALTSDRTHSAVNFQLNMSKGPKSSRADGVKIAVLRKYRACLYPK
jgi:hypothetical protein